jgi:hypothetical protein
MLGWVLTRNWTICDSWIQGHPEYGFGFKALVCHDGVRKLFFSCNLPETVMAGL